MYRLRELSHKAIKKINEWRAEKELIDIDNTVSKQKVKPKINKDPYLITRTSKPDYFNTYKL